MALPSRSRVGGAEGTGGGAGSVLLSPPPPSQLLCALDELLERQEAYRKARHSLQNAWMASVCLLAAAVAVAVLYGG